MHRIFIGLLFVLNLWACDSIEIWIIERHGDCKRWYYKGKWHYSGGTIEIKRDTVCQFYRNPDWMGVQGVMLFYCEPDSCKIAGARFYPDSVYSVLREK